MLRRYGFNECCESLREHRPIPGVLALLSDAEGKHRTHVVAEGRRPDFTAYDRPYQRPRGDDLAGPLDTPPLDLVDELSQIVGAGEGRRIIGSDP